MKRTTRHAPLLHLYAISQCEDPRTAPSSVVGAPVGSSAKKRAKEASLWKMRLPRRSRTNYALTLAGAIRFACLRRDGGL